MIPCTCLSPHLKLASIIFLQVGYGSEPANAALALLREVAVPSIDVREVGFDAACLDALLSLAVWRDIGLRRVIHPELHAVAHVLQWRRQHFEACAVAEALVVVGASDLHFRLCLLFAASEALQEGLLQLLSRGFSWDRWDLSSVAFARTSGLPLAEAALCHQPVDARSLVATAAAASAFLGTRALDAAGEWWCKVVWFQLDEGPVAFDVEPEALHVVLGQGVCCLVPASSHPHWSQAEAVLDLEVGELLHDRVDRVVLMVALMMITIYFQSYRT